MTSANGKRFRTLRRMLRYSGPRAAAPLLIAVTILLLATWQLVVVVGGGDRRVELEAHYHRNADSYLIDAVVRPVLVERVVRSVEDGQRAEVTFTVRRYGPSEEFFGILGDTLIDEVSVSQTLSLDPFTGEYRVRDDRGHDTGYESVVAAIRDFYRISGVPLQFHTANGPDGAEYEIRVRAVVKPLVLARPLFLVEPLLAERTARGGWVTADPGYATGAMNGRPLQGGVR